MEDPHFSFIIFLSKPSTQVMDRRGWLHSNNEFLIWYKQPQCTSVLNFTFNVAKDKQRIGVLSTVFALSACYSLVWIFKNLPQALHTLRQRLHKKIERCLESFYGFRPCCNYFYYKANCSVTSVYLQCFAAENIHNLE